MYRELQPLRQALSAELKAHLSRPDRGSTRSTCSRPILTVSRCTLAVTRCAPSWSTPTP
jgi:hypothetical protein